MKKNPLARGEFVGVFFVFMGTCLVTSENPSWKWIDNTSSIKFKCLGLPMSIFFLVKWGD